MKPHPATKCCVCIWTNGKATEEKFVQLDDDYVEDFMEKQSRGAEEEKGGVWVFQFVNRESSLKVHVTSARLAEVQGGGGGAGWVCEELPENKLNFSQYSASHWFSRKFLIRSWNIGIN